MRKFHFGRIAVVAGLIGAATLTAVLAPVAAQANVRTPPLGSQPGNLILSPASGASTLTPTFSTTTACPTGFQSTAGMVVAANDGTNQGILSAGLPSTIIGAPFSGTLGFDMGTILSVAGPAGQTYEFVIQCNASLTSSQFVQSTFVTFSADGSSWTSSGTPPAGSTPTTTTLTSNTSTAVFGSNVTLIATVAPAAATGTVTFFDGTTSLGTGTLASGSASLSTTTLQVGDHSVTAHYGGSASFGASTSAAMVIHITPASANTGTETINVNVPLSEGVFTLTVSGTPVQMTDAVNNGNFFESTGTLSDVTVSDQRQQSKPGWSVSGQVSNFTSGANSFPGSDLGWTPSVKTQNAAADVVAGPAVPAGTTPGLSGGSGLASAGASKGFGTSVLSAALDLRVPVTTAVGAYSAVLTVTAVTHA
jgi:hypothetical protein